MVVLEGGCGGPGPGFEDLLLPPTVTSVQPDGGRGYIPRASEPSTLIGRDDEGTLDLSQSNAFLHRGREGG